MEIDKRIPLPCNKGYRLKISDKSNGNSYTVIIDKEIGRGGSCITYSGKLDFHIDNTEAPKYVVIKEFYPFELQDYIERNKNNNNDYKLIIKDNKAVSHFEKKLTHFINGQAKHVFFANEHSDNALSSVDYSGRALETFYAISKFNAGEVLTKKVRKKYSLIDALKLTVSICEAISKVHEKYVYLDLKPSNIFVNGTNAYLFDFDTATHVDSIKNCSYSKGFSAPEQEINKAGTGYVDEMKIGYHSDVFSIGAVLFWLLTGKSPYEVGLDNILNNYDWKNNIILNDDNGVLKSKSFPRRLNKIMKKMLCKDADKRRKYFKRREPADMVFNLIEIAEHSPYEVNLKSTETNIINHINTSTQNINNTILNESAKLKRDNKKILINQRRLTAITISIIIITILIVATIMTVITINNQNSISNNKSSTLHNTANKDAQSELELNDLIEKAKEDYAIKMLDKAENNKIKKKAKEGDAESQFMLALIYDEKNDNKNAFKWMKTAAQNNYTRAQTALSYYYGIGYYGKVNNNKEFYWANKAAEKNDDLAQHIVGECYFSGRGTKKDYKKAKEYYMLSAKQNNPAAMAALGTIYLKGYGVEIDKTIALKWLLKSAEQDYWGAEVALGEIYLEGEAVDKDEKTAFMWFKKAAATENYITLYELGQCYLDGTGTEQDVEKGLQLIKKSAEEGYHTAQFVLGYVYNLRFVSLVTVFTITAVTYFALRLIVFKRLIKNNGIYGV